MAKQRIQSDSPTRIEELAEEIYLRLVGRTNGKTSAGLAEESFLKAEAFWDFASNRIKPEKPENQV